MCKAQKNIRQISGYFPEIMYLKKFFISYFVFLLEVVLLVVEEEHLLVLLLVLQEEDDVEEVPQQVPYNWLIAIFQKYSSLPQGQPAFFQL